MIEVDPSELVEVIESSPAIVVNCFSSGVATAEAIVSGLAPARFAETVSVGKSTFGKSLTARPRYAITPNSRIASIVKLVITGRLMKFSAICIPLLALPQRLVLISTFTPGTSRICPSVTTVSPAFTPSVITDSPPTVRATFTTRESTVMSGLITNI